MLLNRDTTTPWSPLYQYFTLLTLHSAYKKQPYQDSIISGKPLFPYPFANGSAVASFTGQDCQHITASQHDILQLPSAPKPHPSLSLLLDFLSSCTVHDHTFPSTPAFTLKPINVFLIWLSPTLIQLMGLSTATAISPCSHMAGIDLHHFLFKNCRWFQPWCFPTSSPVQHGPVGLIPQSVLTSLPMGWMLINAHLNLTSVLLCLGYLPQLLLKDKMA